MEKSYNEELKQHHEKALKHLLILEDMTHYELKEVSKMIDILQYMNFENYDISVLNDLIIEQE